MTIKEALERQKDAIENRVRGLKLMSSPEWHPALNAALDVIHTYEIQEPPSGKVTA